MDPCSLGLLHNAFIGGLQILEGPAAVNIVDSAQQHAKRRGLHHHRAVVGLVVRQGLLLALVGAALGLAGAFATSGLVEGLVVGVDASRPWVYATVALGLVGIALVASYLPARRATRIDPLEAIRPD